MEIRQNGNAGSNPQELTKPPSDATIKPMPSKDKDVAQVSEHKDAFKKELQDEVAALNKFMQAKETHLKFNLHEKLGEYYVQVIDNKTDEVVREIPSKKMMDTVAQMYELIGIMVDRKI
ncbi:flagellar protein FlaG [Brevibacterium sp. JNUCC-42]|nr:flagellar protein FlaG [Brevibacterium sp. JNUCC-42]